MNENKIRPGIRAKWDKFPSDPCIVISIEGDHCGIIVESLRTAEWVPQSELAPLPFWPGDRVEVKTRDDGVKRATVIKLDHIMKEGYTPVHVDGTDEVDGFYAEAITLIDYDGKETE